MRAGRHSFRLSSLGTVRRKNWQGHRCSVGGWVDVWVGITLAAEGANQLPTTKKWVVADGANGHTDIYSLSKNEHSSLFLE